MVSPLLLPLLAGLSLGAEPAPARLEFRDAAVYDGRSMLHYRTLELGEVPVRPVTQALAPGPGARYGLVLVGSSLDTALTVVWDSKAAGGPHLWLDANGDGQLTADERHTLTRRETEIAAVITVDADKGPQRLRRTLVFRRRALDDGLNFTVRGFALGTLTLGGTAYPTLLTDGNADGCFHTVAADRVWIDLNRDGRFDGLTEQFPLGTPITVGGQTYVIRSDATASGVRVQPRTTARGTVRLTLTPGPGRPVDRFSAQLVSDLGELVMVRDLGQPVAIPAARYRVDALEFQLTDSRGQTWSYCFAGGGRYDLAVSPDQDTAAALLAELTLDVTVAVPDSGAAPGQSLAVTPRLRTPSGLYLADCTVRAANAVEPARCTADIRLYSPLGRSVDRASSGFL